MRRILTLAFVCALTLSTSAQWANSAGDVPAYNAEPPKKGAKLRPILSGKALTSPTFQYPFQAASYKVAAKVDGVLYQLPCYCYCDRSPAKHNSLRSCFEDEHGANCSTCMQEAFYAYKLTKQKKTPKEIREGIKKGEHRRIDLRFASVE